MITILQNERTVFIHFLKAGPHDHLLKQPRAQEHPIMWVARNKSSKKI